MEAGIQSVSSPPRKTTQTWAAHINGVLWDLDDVHADQTSVTDDPVGHVYENHTGFDAIDTFKVGINWRFN
jgi:hypothetical protein